MVPIETRILTETERWIAVHKHCGELVVVDRWGKVPKEEILIYKVGAYLEKKGHRNDEKGRNVFPVHRLDRDTSGIVLFAKDAEAHRALSMMFESRQMEKLYWAFCFGEVLWDYCINSIPLERAEGKSGRGRAHIDLKSKKETMTEFRVLARSGPFSWVEAKPRTGRLHQIRLHLDILGHSILCDPLYGPSSVEISFFSPLRLALHARELSFVDPFSHQNIALSCPLDDSLRQLVTIAKQKME